MIKLIKRLFYFPGFGGPRIAAPPPPPAAPLAAPRKTDIGVQRARAGEIRRSKLATGLSGTNRTGGVLVDQASLATKTLLG
jgi:hypothetical protein